MFRGLGLKEPPKRPPCLSVAHLLVVKLVLAVFFGPMLTYFGSNLLKLSIVTFRGSLSPSPGKKKFKFKLISFN